MFPPVVPPSDSPRRRAPTWSESRSGCSWPSRRNWWGGWWPRGEWFALWNPSQTEIGHVEKNLNLQAFGHLLIDPHRWVTDQLRLILVQQMIYSSDQSRLRSVKPQCLPKMFKLKQHLDRTWFFNQQTAAIDASSHNLTEKSMPKPQNNRKYKILFFFNFFKRHSEQLGLTKSLSFFYFFYKRKTKTTAFRGNVVSLTFRLTSDATLQTSEK